MVSIEFDDDPTAETIETAVERIQATGNMPRGITGGRALEYDGESETLRVNFDNLRQVLLEHRMFEEAEGFSSTEMALLRIIEAGPERMSFQEIQAQVADHDEIDSSLADSTLQYYLRKLRDKQLVEHGHNQYSYLGP